MDQGGDQELRLRRNDLIWREIEGQVVALDSQTWEYLSVNESGRLLWDRLVEGATKDHLVEFMINTYEVSAETALADVEAFLAMLRERDLLQGP